MADHFVLTCAGAAGLSQLQCGDVSKPQVASYLESVYSNPGCFADENASWQCFQGFPGKTVNERDLPQRR